MRWQDVLDDVLVGLSATGIVIIALLFSVLTRKRK